MTALARVAERLEAHTVPYALIGAAALAAHGVARSTFDLDLLTRDTRVLAPAFWANLVGVTAEIRRGDAADPLAGVVRLRAPSERDIDVVVGRAAWLEAVIARAGTVQTAGVTLPVVGAADLILLKLFAGGSQDAWDIEQLLAAGDRALLAREVEERLGVLSVESRALWMRLRGQ